MILDPFVGPSLKVERGWQHIESLATLYYDFLDQNSPTFEQVPPTLSPSKGEILGVDAYRIHFSKTPSLEMATTLGDAVHNLRSSLDLLVCDIARLRGLPSSHFKFPFGADEPTFEARLKSLKIHKLGEDVTTAIRQLKPYREGLSALRDLHELDIIDKHELLVPVVLQCGALHNMFGFRALGMMAVMNDRLGVHLDHKLILSDNGTNSLITTENGEATLHMSVGDPSPERFFQDGQVVEVPTICQPNEVVGFKRHRGRLMFPSNSLPFSGLPVLETLEGVAQLVGEIVASFTLQFGSGNADTT